MGTCADALTSARKRARWRCEESCWTEGAGVLGDGEDGERRTARACGSSYGGGLAVMNFGQA